MSKTLVVFDFDWTLIDDNSDTVFVDELVPGTNYAQKRDGLTWTAFMVAVLTFVMSIS
jgi:hypothetical protein